MWLLSPLQQKDKPPKHRRSISRNKKQRGRAQGRERHPRTATAVGRRRGRQEQEGTKRKAVEGRGGKEGGRRKQTTLAIPFALRQEGSDHINSRAGWGAQHDKHIPLLSYHPKHKNNQIQLTTPAHKPCTLRGKDSTSSSWDAVGAARGQFIVAGNAGRVADFTCYPGPERRWMQLITPDPDPDWMGESIYHAPTLAYSLRFPPLFPLFFPLPRNVTHPRQQARNNRASSTKPMFLLVPKSDF